MARRGLATRGARQRVGIIVVHISGFGEENRQRLLDRVCILRALSATSAKFKRPTEQEEEEAGEEEAGEEEAAMDGRKVEKRRKRV